MAASILALYRSAVDVGKEWAPDFHDIPRLGLVIIPSEDPFCPLTLRAPALTELAHRPPISRVSVTGGCSKTQSMAPSCLKTSGRQ
jgi:hypothetical protein